MIKLTSDKVSFHLFCIGSSLKLFSLKLYIISLAWLGFDIALLKGLMCNWLEKARIYLNASWY